MTRSLTRTTLATALAFGTVQIAQADDETLHFGVPAWPGITVKTEIAEQLLNPLGYETTSQELGLQVIYQGLDSGDLDVFLGGWLPAQNDMFNPREEEGSIVSIANNVDGAQMTLAVPDYIYDQGVTSFEDLDENREMFDGEIYGFGSGSAASEILNKAMENDTWGLGDWELVDTSEVGMLSAARDAMSREEPIIWVGWTPHWMNLEFSMNYLEDPEDLFGENNGESEVLTIARSGYADAHPNLVTFFEQFVFDHEEQSWMIKEFGQEERDADAVAEEWIRDNSDRIEAMLDGVTTKEGDDAWPVIQAQYDL
ncbi:ABC transporter substrate-binding protein [Aidingimonas halophila]|uniref:Glycine betaine/proline transport system substrate-binding protein n=1 Tax=Aidingimonas halophila TaxID=574349 RepID=A0A1H2SPW3_9GAMM|nr:ABC transporter substrate-binding protein [Aidingimonas halophila]GHC17309.1 glycine/betaine ABC transporter substrate-binding protein [Aidingimonas halophila]SDW33693.1 glycine betaine/proline transport system substrate-binding protein [Aidingimonas halophila]